jgi:hypothetical protein
MSVILFVCGQAAARRAGPLAWIPKMFGSCDVLFAYQTVGRVAAIFMQVPGVIFVFIVLTQKIATHKVAL